MSDTPTPTLGQVIKAGRYRFHWLDDPGCFVRVTSVGDNGVFIECAEPGGLPRFLNAVQYSIWWGDEYLERELSKIVKRRLKGRTHGSFSCDEHGKILR